MESCLGVVNKIIFTQNLCNYEPYHRYREQEENCHMITCDVKGCEGAIKQEKVLQRYWEDVL